MTALVAMTPACQRQPQSVRAAIVGGAPSTADVAVVALVAPPLACGDDEQLLCSGALVGPRAVLTAAHCVNLAPPGTLRLFAGSEVGGTGMHLEVNRAWTHPDYDGVDHDLAILSLRAPVDDIAPLAIDDRTIDDSFVGESVRVAGFGADDDGVVGARRQGTSRVSEVGPLTFVSTPAPGNSCEGDSGGPVVRASDSGDAIAGVTVSGDPGCALTGVNARVDVELAWIDDTLAAIDSRPAPGNEPPSADDCTDGGCSAGGRGAWWLLLVLVALLVGCGRTGAAERASGPCPAGTTLRGAPPPDGRAQWCERRGAKHGPWTEWYADGRVKSRGAFADGQMTGRWVHYQPDGAVADEGNYVAGVKDGPWKSFEDGRVVRATTYSRRGAEARFTAYRDDGSRWAEGVFLDQKENGPYREWHANGQLAAEGSYRDGERVGSWHYWEPDGTPTDVEQGAFAGQD